MPNASNGLSLNPQSYNFFAHNRLLTIGGIMPYSHSPYQGVEPIEVFTDFSVGLKSSVLETGFTTGTQGGAGNPQYAKAYNENRLLTNGDFGNQALAVMSVGILPYMTTLPPMKVRLYRYTGGTYSSSLSKCTDNQYGNVLWDEMEFNAGGNDYEIVFGCYITLYNENGTSKDYVKYLHACYDFNAVSDRTFDLYVASIRKDAGWQRIKVRIWSKYDGTPIIGTGSNIGSYTNFSWNSDGSNEDGIINTAGFHYITGAENLIIRSNITLGGGKQVTIRLSLGYYVIAYGETY